MTKRKIKHKHKFTKVVTVSYSFGNTFKRKKCKCGAMKDTFGDLLKCVDMRRT